MPLIGGIMVPLGDPQWTGKHEDHRYYVYGSLIRQVQMGRDKGKREILYCCDQKITVYGPTESNIRFMAKCDLCGTRWAANTGEALWHSVIQSITD